jgi:16S rRNA C967 or C1407 C5-methylase (RsmB/RsmF family)
MESVLSIFENNEQMKRVKTIADMGKRTFCIDYHCPNLLVFHYSQKQRLTNHHLVRDNHLYLQDKSSCIAAHSVRKLLTKKDNICLSYVSGGKNKMI